MKRNKYFDETDPSFWEENSKVIRIPMNMNMKSTIETAIAGRMTCHRSTDNIMLTAITTMI